MPAITTDAYLDFDEPWITTGDFGNPTISTGISYAASSGDESLVVDSNSDFPVSYPQVFSAFSSTNNLVLPEIGRLTTAIGSGATAISIAASGETPQSSPFSVTIGSETLTATGITYDTGSAVLNLTSGTSGGWPANTPVHLAAYDTASTYTALEVPRFYYTSKTVSGNSPSTALPNTTYINVSPIPCSLTQDTLLTIRQGSFQQDLMLAGVAVAGTTVIPVANSKFTATVTNSTTLTVTSGSAAGLFVNQWLLQSGAIIGNISKIDATTSTPVLTVTSTTGLTVGNSYTFYSAFYSFYDWTTTTFVNGVPNGNYNVSGNTDATGATLSVKLNQPVPFDSPLVISTTLTAVTSGSTTISQTPVDLTLTAAPTGWAANGAFQITINGIPYTVYYTSISGSVLSGVVVADGSFTIPSASTISAYYSQILTTTRTSTIYERKIDVQPFQPNYPYTPTSSLVATYSLSLDTGANQETFYPVSAPISLAADGFSAPYQVQLGVPLSNSHTVGSIVQWYKMPSGSSPADVVYRPDLDQFQMFDGFGWRKARVQSVQPIYTMLGANGGSDKELFSLFDPVTKAESSQDIFTNNSSVAYTTHYGSYFGNDPNGNEWSEAVLARLQLHIQAAVPAGKNVAFRSTGLHIYYKSEAKARNVVISPRDTVTFTPDETFAVAWEFDDFDGDTQNGWQVRIFEELAVRTQGFSADSTTPLWSASGGDDASQVEIDPSIGFKDNTNYYAFVRVAKTFQNNQWFGQWTSVFFRVDPAQPQLPMMAVYADGQNAYNHVIVQSSDNLLSQANADFPTTIGNWRATGNDTATTALTLGRTGTSNTNRLTKNAAYSQLTVGATAYLKTAIPSSGTLTVSISGSSSRNTWALGLPTSGAFWVRIGGENILLQTVTTGSATSVGTYQIKTRNYAVPGGPSSTLSSHSLNDTISFGLQSPIYANSISEIKWAEVVPHTTRTPIYTRVLTSGGTASVPVRFQIQRGNSRQHPHSVVIYDPNHAFYAPKGGSGKKVNVYYRHYSYWSSSLTGSAGNKKVKQTLVTANSNGFEVATISSVSANGPDVKGGWLQFGQTTADCFGQKTFVSPGVFSYQNLTSVPIKMTISMASPLFNTANGCMTQAALKAGTKIRFLNTTNNKSMTATLSQGWKQGQATMHIHGIGNGFNFIISTSGGGSVFKIPSGTQVSVWQDTVPSALKTVTFVKNTIGQGKWKGLFTTVGDYIETTNIATGGSRATYTSKQSGTKTTTTYTTLNHHQKFNIAPRADSGYAPVVIPSANVTVSTAGTAPVTYSSATITGTATLNQYQGWYLSGDGIRSGTRVASNTATSGGTYTIVLSFPGNVVYGTYSGATPGTPNSHPNMTFTHPTADITPAGSQTIWVENFQPQTDYPAGCPISISMPTKFSSADAVTNPIVVTPGANPASPASGVAEMGIWDGKAWADNNSVVVQPSGWYGLGAFAKTLIPTYQAFTATSISGYSITASSTAGLRNGMTVNGPGISAGTSITAISGSTLTMNKALTAGSGVSCVATTVPTFSLLIDWYDEGRNFISTSNGTTSFSTGATNSFTPGIRIGAAGLNPQTYPNEARGFGIYPNGIVAQAPYNVAAATNATFAYDLGTTATGKFTIAGGGASKAIRAGTTLATTGGIKVVATSTTAIGATSIPVRTTAQPESTSTSLLLNATRACPRVQLSNVAVGDIYALSNVLFQALQPALPLDGTAGNYSILNSAIPAISAASDSQLGSGNGLSVPAATPMGGAKTLWLIDPTNDNSTREIHFGMNVPEFSASLVQATFVGSTQVTLSNADDLAMSGQLIIGYGTATAETVSIDLGNWDGSLTIPLSTPIWYAHPAGTVCYAVSASLDHELYQTQAVGTRAAALTWNNSGWLNGAGDTYTYKVERSEDSGSTWTTLRKGSSLSADKGGYAKILDYECSPGVNAYYRSTATSLNNDFTSNGDATPVGGLTTPAVGPAVLNVTSWWISSTSDDTLRYAIAVQNKVEETQKHPVGVFYPLGSSRPYTIAGQVQGRDSKITVIWTDDDNWGNFIDLLNLGETLVLVDPVESARRYIFIHDDIQVTHHAAQNPYRELVISYVEAAPPGFGYSYGNK